MMSDEELQRFYERAAHDEAFREALWNDPDGTIDATDLAPHVKAMLKSVSAEELAVMVRKATGMKPVRWGTIGKVVLGLAVVAMVVALLLRPDVPWGTPPQTRALACLHLVALSEAQYKEQYGTFATIGDLARFDESGALAEWLFKDGFPYEFTITVEGDTFIAIARHKTRPGTRKAFVVGPDGQVKELKGHGAPEQ